MSETESSELQAMLDDGQLHIDDLRARIVELEAALNTVGTMTVRTVAVDQSEGPYQDAGLQDVLCGDWELIQKVRGEA